MPNVNDTYFDGFYKEVWRNIIPDTLTEREINFLVSWFNLKPGDSVLDLMCGYGRHALLLAKKGIEVTAIDNLSSYIEEIKKKASEQLLPVHAIHYDVREFIPESEFQLVICMGNSLNFYNKDDTIQILNRISKSLNKTGHLLINTWSLAEIVLPTFKEKNDLVINDFECFNECRYLFHPSRIETKTFITYNGIREEKFAIDYIYSINEIEELLTDSGLKFEDIYSIPGKKRFSIGDPRAYIIASKK